MHYLLCRLLKVSTDGIPIFCLNVRNKTLKILCINGLSAIQRHILTATYSRPTQFYFLDYRCLNDLLQTSNMYIHTSHLPSACPRKENLWMEIIYQLLDRYLRPGLVWYLDCVFSRSWPRDAVSYFVECTVPVFFPVSLNIPLSGDLRTHLKIIILIISLNHWLLSLLLLPLLLPLYFQIPSAWEITHLSENAYHIFVPPSHSFYRQLYLWTLLQTKDHLCVSMFLIRIQ